MKIKQEKYFKSKCETLLAPHDYYSLKDLITDFTSLIEQGVTHLEIDLEHTWGDDEIVINLYEYREETDEEVNERIAKEKRASVRQKEQEYKAYLELKAKFDGIGN